VEGFGDNCNLSAVSGCCLGRSQRRQQKIGLQLSYTLSWLVTRMPLDYYES